MRKPKCFSRICDQLLPSMGLFLLVAVQAWRRTRSPTVSPAQVAATLRRTTLPQCWSGPVIGRRVRAGWAGYTSKPLIIPRLSRCPQRPQRRSGASLGGGSLPANSSVTMGLIALWYLASCVCNETSRKLLSSTALGAQGLTLVQLVIASSCGAFDLFLLRKGAYQSLRSLPQLRDMALLAVAFTFGFATLNASFGQMHVSLVMVLRAAEPITTLLLAYLLLPNSEHVPLARALALIPVVLGAALSSAGGHAPTALGLALVFASNLCFSLRGILSKRIASAYNTDAFSLFFQLSVLGTLAQAVLVAALCVLLHWELPHLPVVAAFPMLVLNGVSFYAYLQLSWVCLGRMSAVSHSVANSIRRPATIVAALCFSPMRLSLLDAAGMGLACAGALLYGLLP